MLWNFRFKYFRYKRIIGGFTIGIGALLLLFFLPSWIWMCLIGMLLIGFGMIILKN
ncbi:hypothetical protein [Thermovenabulum gondwanense]|uniref:hypothetical protein n=1 Tax=Thermovenabulum gondwanense TaxID=520767 RepID=UPI000AE8D518|nr:hypothetical protein [Thermovenabulum gondwanense]